MSNAECGMRKAEPSSAPERSPAIFVVGLTSLIVLWLPPLPYAMWAADIPQPFLDALLVLGAFKPTDVWPLRWDYLLFPPLFYYALRVTWKSGISIRECGLGVQYFSGALRKLWLPTLIGSVILLVFGASSHPLEFGLRFWKRLIPFPALIQQMAIQLFFYRQLVLWLGAGRKTAWILSIFFMMLHAPNPGLMLGTLFGMYFWTRCYQQQPNLYAIALSHAILSAVLMQTMPRWLLPSVSVGHRFVEKGIAQGWWGW